MTHDLGANLDQLFVQRRLRPVPIALGKARVCLWLGTEVPGSRIYVCLYEALAVKVVLVCVA